MVKKNQKINRKKSSKKRTKKKLGFFYRFHFSIITISAFLLCYFLIFVAMGPKSFSFITQKIEEKVIAELGEGSSINQSSIEFTAYGSLKVAIGGLNIFYSQKSHQQNREFFTIPRIEAEFPLVNFLFLNFKPTKVKISKPSIIINDLKHLGSSSKEEILANEVQLSAVVKVLSTIRKGDNPIENIEIEDAKFIILSDEGKTEILLKNSKIKASSEDAILNILSRNQISFDLEKRDVNLDANCHLSKSDGLGCDLFLDNFAPISISNIHPSLANLAKISALFDANISFGVNHGEFSNVKFEFRSAAGNFKFLNLLAKPLSFKDFSAAGEYDSKLQILNISSIESDFITPLSQQNLEKLPHLSMSMVLSNLISKQKSSRLFIKLKNIPTNELDNFWPINLGKKSSRPWSVKYLKDGIIEDAMAKFTINHGGENSGLQHIDASLNFSGVNLAYSKSFPAISNMSAQANFTKNDMIINISAGDLLNSKITKALVEIRNFSDPKNMLYISGELEGEAGDGLRHANNSAEFSNNIEKYLNGLASSKFDVRVSLAQPITLNNSYIYFESLATNLRNDFLSGAALIKTKKDFNSNNFVTNIDLESTKISVKELEIYKKPNSSAKLSFILDVIDGKNLNFRKILLSANKNRSMSGRVELVTSPTKIKKITLRNQNFGRNNFSLTYLKRKKFQKIILKGSSLDLGALIKNKTLSKLSSANSGSSHLRARIYLSKLILANNHQLSNFSLAFDCNRGMCFSGLAKANYLENDIIDLKISKKKYDNFALIAGKISDLGYLAEGFGILDVISGGNAQINIKNSRKKSKMILDGEVEINKDITIYETAAVKKLAKNNLFSKIKDKIFSHEKTTFNSLKTKFNFENNLLTIHSLVANNYKIGITAKGFLNVKKSTYNLKGMIIPGFLVNNLFGVGKIPLIGGVIKGILTGGEEEGGVFGIRYEYVKNNNDQEGEFSTDVVASFVPTTIQNLFKF